MYERAGCVAQVTVPTHRMTPLKNAWLALYQPVTENLKLDMRMNLKTRKARHVFVAITLLKAATASSRARSWCCCVCPAACASVLTHISLRVTCCLSKKTGVIVATLQSWS